MEKVCLVLSENHDAAQVESSLRSTVEALAVVLPTSQARVFIKPNCVFAHPKYVAASYTHPELIHAAVRLPKGSPVTVGEHRMRGFPSRLAREQAGYMRLAKEESFTRIPMHEARFVSVPLSHSHILKQVALPHSFQSSFDDYLPHAF